MYAYRSCVCFLLISALATPATAQTQSSVTPWIGATGGFSTYSMRDVNEEINNIDALIPAKFDDIKSGFGFGADAGLDVHQRWRIGAHYERLLAGSDVGDETGSLEYNLPANAVYGSVEFLPPRASSVKIGLGASGGVVMAAGTIEFAVAGVGAVSGDVSGSGPYFDAHLSVDVPLGAQVVLTPALGYRWANVTGVELEGEPVYTDTGDEYDVDYSGILAHVSLRILL